MYQASLIFIIQNKAAQVQTLFLLPFYALSAAKGVVITMILTGIKIAEEVENGKITISPYNNEQLTTNTYDLTLGVDLLEYKNDVIDTKKENEYFFHKIPEDGYFMKKGDFLLGCSDEIIGSDYYVPLIHAKSGIARLGLFVHVTADLIDIGFKGRVTFQLYATQNIILYPKQKIGQVSFWKPKGKIELYNGKYMGANLPAASQVHKEFFK